MNLVETLIQLATQQLAWQFDTYTSLETKTVGVLAFDGALGAFIAVLHPMPEAFRILFFGYLLVSIAACLAALAIRRVYAGSSVVEFYGYTREQTDEDALRSLLSSLGKNYQINRAPLAKNGIYWTLAAGALVASVVVVGIDFVW